VGKYLHSKNYGHLEQALKALDKAR
jgi:hypothetical protein